jgi:hypothetical protein
MRRAIKLYVYFEPGRRGGVEDMMQKEKTPPLEVVPVDGGDAEVHRREILTRLGRAVGYAAPVSVAMLSMKANAAS